MEHQRRRFNQSQTLEERLADFANRLREEAKVLPPGPAREELLQRLRETETASHMMSELQSSPGRQPK